MRVATMLSSSLQNQASAALEALVFRSVAGARLTQDSPILPDVWIRYGLIGGDETVDLLLAPHRQSSAIGLARALRAALRRRADAGLVHTQGIVAARLDLRDLIGAALPLTRWWHRYLLSSREGEPAAELLAVLADPQQRARLREALIAGLSELLRSAPEPAPSLAGVGGQGVTGDLLWLAFVAGTIALLQRDGGLSAIAGAAGIEGVERAITGPSDAERVDAFLELLAGRRSSPPAEHLWSVNRNRRGDLAMTRSTATVKADAARAVFGVTGQGLRWAVLDSGIDARHLAFRARDRRGAPLSLRTTDGDWSRTSRVVATYDFTRIRELLAAPSLDAAPADLQLRFADPAARAAADCVFAAAHERGIDWMRWKDILTIPHRVGAYVGPRSKHGTHVAGILAADWRPDDDMDDALESEREAARPERARLGVCPEIELYDIRVADADGAYDEFSLIAALQFVRACNAEHEHVEIAGVNLSLSLRHDVANYACGRTPVCDECDRVVASGVVVVAAAGNRGRTRYLTTDGELEEGYRDVSITDPGNAESVITVGATHRSDPHAYGVSYFSSRGPSGDGRQKPDLVAPGEKIMSTVPGDREERMDGTSMAAPHVSGAAALLLSRHPELIGRPGEIKRILQRSAIDLGRERYFQGAGLLDILAALESV
jgi:serine protease AprX